MANYYLTQTGAVIQELLDRLASWNYGGATTNVGNDYSVASPDIAELLEGMVVVVKINADSTGATTLNWDGKGAKPILKTSGGAMNYLKAGGIYTLRYDGANFIVQGEGANGNATASDLLSGKTATVDAGEITGTMPNWDGVSKDNVGITSDESGNLWLNPPAGYYDVDSAVHAQDADFINANIKYGTQFLGKTGTFKNIKSIQFVTITIPTSATTNTATISSITTANSVVVFLGSTASSASATTRSAMAYLSITDATTITATREYADASYTITVTGMVIEFDVAVKSNQVGSITHGASSGTATITSVDTTKTLLLPRGYSSASSTGAPTWTNCFARLVLTNSTTVTSYILTYSASYIPKVYFTAIEFY